MDPTSADFIHLQAECLKLAYADREAFYGDPEFVDVPMQTLLSDAYNSDRRQLIDRERASLEQRPGKVDGYGGVVKLVRADAARLGVSASGAGEPTVGRVGQTTGDTVHFDIVDREGNMISATPSGGWLQSSPVVPELGFPISTRGQMFWLDEGLPSTLRPGTRPRTTLTPTLVTRDGQGYLAIGTPGGDQQDQWPLTVFLRHILHRQGLQSAIDAPMFHSKHWPGSFYPREYELGRPLIEDRYSASTLASLRERGHKLSVQDSWSLGRVCAV